MIASSIIFNYFNFSRNVCKIDITSSSSKLWKITVLIVVSQSLEKCWLNWVSLRFIWLTFFGSACGELYSVSVVFLPPRDWVRDGKGANGERASSTSCSRLCKLRGLLAFAIFTWLLRGPVHPVCPCVTQRPSDVLGTWSLVLIDGPLPSRKRLPVLAPDSFVLLLLGCVLEDIRPLTFTANTPCARYDWPFLLNDGLVGFSSHYFLQTLSEQFHDVLDSSYFFWHWSRPS